MKTKSIFFSPVLFFLHVFTYFVCACQCVCVSHGACVKVREQLYIVVSLLPKVPVIKLRSSGLVAGAFTLGALSPVLRTESRAPEVAPAYTT